jgi:hypothetical protein
VDLDRYDAWSMILAPLLKAGTAAVIITFNKKADPPSRRMTVADRPYSRTC